MLEAQIQGFIIIHLTDFLLSVSTDMHHVKNLILDSKFVMFQNYM